MKIPKMRFPRATPSQAEAGWVLSPSFLGEIADDCDVYADECDKLHADDDYRLQEPRPGRAEVEAVLLALERLYGEGA